MNRDRFTEIVTEYTPKLLNYIMKFVHQREDAEDILQSVFVSFYDKMENVDQQKTSPYLYRACHNNAIDFIKKRKKILHFSPADFENIADLGKEEKEELYNEIIKEALSAIPAKMSLLIEMKIYQKKSYKEISQETGYSIKAIESQLVRAKKKLRQIIEKKVKNDLGILL